jgi:predicted Rossmann fold flavoprotein
MSTKDTIYDVAVIGGGPAGMMAAGRAAELGAKVVLIEKKPRLGTKLLMTGGGRCNLTQAEFDTRRLVEAYGPNGKFLYSAFSRFGVAGTMEFFESRGLKLKTEAGGRVFPKSDRAADVLKVLSDYLRKGKVKVLTRTPVAGISSGDGAITGIRLDENEITAAHYIVCTGGKSYPSTGSTGEAYRWLKRLGHTITPLVPVLAPVRVREGWVRRAEGASVTDAALHLLVNSKNKATARGEAVFTRDGLSGPAALDMTRLMRGHRDGDMTLVLDLRPDTGLEELDRELIALFREHENMLAGNCISLALSPKLAPLYMKLSGISPGTRVNSVTRDERKKLAGLIKGLTMGVSGISRFNRAMVTGGGVGLDEIDQKTMRSKLVPNLSIVGEVLDLDGPTGGYNLQICWSTGYVAGDGWNAI